jgi:hypothetical protein
MKTGRVAIYGLMMAATWAVLGASIMLHLTKPMAGIGGLIVCLLCAALTTTRFIIVANAKPKADKRTEITIA